MMNNYIHSTIYTSSYYYYGENLKYTTFTATKFLSYEESIFNRTYDITNDIIKNSIEIGIRKVMDNE